MLTCNSLLKFSLASIVILTGLGVYHVPLSSQGGSFNLASEGLAQPIQSNVEPQSLAALIDGNYQFCSQAEPTDWHVGAGVCFNFNKLGHHVEGYYGYPHSDRFICIRGEVDGNLITGEALAVSWTGLWWNEIPKSAFKWDAEARLTLDQGEIIQTSGDAQNRVEWILFHSAVLNIDGFYQYSTPRMTSPPELCHFP